MIPTQPAYPSIDDTRGTNFPDQWHAGLSKQEFFLAMALQGALASGKGAEEAAIAAEDSVNAIIELLKEGKKGATATKQPEKQSKPVDKNAYR